jgi:hypothetical protein
MKKFEIKNGNQVSERENRERFKERLSMIIVFSIGNNPYCSFLLYDKWMEE